MQKILATSDGVQGNAARRVDRQRRLVVLAMVAAVLASGIVWVAERVADAPHAGPLGNVYFCKVKPSVSVCPLGRRWPTSL